MTSHQSDHYSEKKFRFLLSIGLLFNSSVLLLDRFTALEDFFLGFLTGIGLTFLGIACYYRRAWQNCNLFDPTD